MTTGYQYSIIRYRHDLAAGEQANVGLVMWVPTTCQLFVHITDKFARLAAFFSGFDGMAYRGMAKQLRTRLRDASDRLKQEQLSLIDKQPRALRELLDELIPRDSSCFQWSDPGFGIVDEPENRFGKLISEFIGASETHARPRRDESEVWSVVLAGLQMRGILDRMQLGVKLSCEGYEYSFRAGWANHTTHVLEPISFDILNARELVEKANTWTGRLFQLREKDFAMTGVISRPPSQELEPAYDSAVRLLLRAPHVESVVTEDNLDQLLESIERDIGHT